MSKSYQLAIIGSGTAGREAAILAGRNGLHVVLIESNALGGTSFHRGYYSIRAFRACAALSRERSGLPLKQWHSENELTGWLSTQAQLSGRLVRELQATLDSAGIDICRGRASLLDGNTISIVSDSARTERLRADYIFLATGSRPRIDGKDLGAAFENIDQFLGRSYFPERLLIVGGGYVGCEIASILRSLGSTVTLVEKNRLLPDWDEFIGTSIARTLHDAGVRLHFGHEVNLQHSNGTKEEPSFALGDALNVSADLVLVTTGRKPNIEDLELESLGIEAAPFIRVDECMRTSVLNVFAIGDVNGLGSMDSLAVAQARTAVGMVLGRKTRYCSRSVPRCLHTDPPVASVGWTEEDADRAGLSTIAHRQSFRLVTEDAESVLEPARLMLKILVDSGSRQMLGVHALGRHAAEIVNTAALAIQSGTTIDKLSEIIFVHPSPAEAIQACLLHTNSLMTQFGARDAVPIP